MFLLYDILFSSIKIPEKILNFIKTNKDDSYTVMVKTNNLTSDDVAKILGILVKETGVSATNVKVLSV